jgi:hypothetical protein
MLREKLKEIMSKNAQKHWGSYFKDHNAPYYCEGFKDCQSELLPIAELAQQLVDDIETPKRLGLGEVNPNWTTLNLLKAKLQEYENQQGEES